MKKLLHWLRKPAEDHTQTTIIADNVDENGNSIWKFPPRPVELSLNADLDDTDTFEVLDAPPEPKKQGPGGIDPYNTGAFNKGKAWGSVKKR